MLRWNLCFCRWKWFFHRNMNELISSRYLLCNVDHSHKTHIIYYVYCSIEYRKFRINEIQNKIGFPSKRGSKQVRAENFNDAIQ